MSSKFPSKEELLRDSLDACPPGRKGAREYEKICVEILEFLFPELGTAVRQSKTRSGTDRRDAIFSTRYVESGLWSGISREFDATMIIFEFKNYDTQSLTPKDVNQLSNYMKPWLGRLAILCSTKAPGKNVLIKQNSIFLNERKLILIITTEHLKKMLTMKERGIDPVTLIVEELDKFYLQSE